MWSDVLGPPRAVPPAPPMEPARVGRPSGCGDSATEARGAAVKQERAVEAGTFELTSVAADEHPGHPEMAMVPEVWRREREQVAELDVMGGEPEAVFTVRTVAAGGEEPDGVGESRRVMGTQGHGGAPFELQKEHRWPVSSQGQLATRVGRRHRIGRASRAVGSGLTASRVAASLAPSSLGSHSPSASLDSGRSRRPRAFQQPQPPLRWR